MPPFKFTQWDGKLLREIPRLRVKPGVRLDPATVKTSYADMAIESFRLFDRLQQEGAIPAGIKFQISLPTPIAPTYNNMVPTDRPALIPVLTTHMLGEVAAIAQALPNDRIALQWDVCQEVIAWEGYYEPGPVEFRTETLDELIEIGDAVIGNGSSFELVSDWRLGDPLYHTHLDGRAVTVEVHIASSGLPACHDPITRSPSAVRT